MDYLPVAHIRAIQTTLYLTTSAWTEAKVSTDRLPARKWIEIYNKTPYKMYYSYDNTMNVSGSFGIKAGGKFIAPLSESVPLYIRGSSGTQSVVVAEIS